MPPLLRSALRRAPPATMIVIKRKKPLFRVGLALFLGSLVGLCKTILAQQFSLVNTYFLVLIRGLYQDKESTLPFEKKGQTLIEGLPRYSLGVNYNLAFVGLFYGVIG